LPHEGLVRAAGFSPVGKSVLTAGRENVAHLWNIETRQPVVIPTNTWISTVAFSPDGRTILTANDDHTAQVWDGATLQPIGSPWRHQGGVTAAAWSLNGRVALTGSADSTARLWNPATGRPLACPLRHAGGVNGVAIDPDGRAIWTAAGDIAGSFGEIRIWQFAPELVVPFSPSEHALIKSLAFSPDGSQIVTGNGEGVVQMWSVAPSIFAPPSRPWGQVFNLPGKFSTCPASLETCRHHLPLIPHPSLFSKLGSTEPSSTPSPFILTAARSFLPAGTARPACGMPRPVNRSAGR